MVYVNFQSSVIATSSLTAKLVSFRTHNTSGTRTHCEQGGVNSVLKVQNLAN